MGVCFERDWEEESAARPVGRRQGRGFDCSGEGGLEGGAVMELGLVEVVEGV